MMSRLSLRLLFCIVGLCCLLGGGARAQGIDLGTVSRSVELAGQVEILEDPSALLRPEVALVRPGWESATPQRLRPGASASAWWLRLRLHNGGTQPVMRWLVLGSPRLEWVDAFRFSAGGGQLLAALQGGVGRPLGSRPVAGTASIFPVELQPGERSELLLRVAGRTRLLIDLSLWEPVAFREHEGQRQWRQMILITALLVMALFALVHGLAFQDRHILLFGCWMLATGLCGFSFHGYLYRYVFTDGGEIPLRATLLFGSLVLLLCLAFTVSFLGLGRLRGGRWFCEGLIVLAIGLVLLAAFGPLRAANLCTIAFGFLLYLLWPLLMLTAWWLRLPNAGLYCAVTLGFWLATLLRLLEQGGLTDAVFLPSDRLAMVASLGPAFVLIFGMVRRSVAESRAFSRAQQALLQASEGEQTRLEQAVRTRTQALQDVVLAADEANRVNNDLVERVGRDLRQPLEQVIAEAEQLMLSGAQEAEYGAIIQRSAGHLLALIDDLADRVPGSQEPRALNWGVVAARALLRGIAADARLLAESRGNRFAYEQIGALPAWIEVDATRLRQVLDNLLNNAAKFTRGGRIDFRVEVRADEGHRADAPMEFVFTVADTGPGIPAQDLPTIFEPFRRSKSTAACEGLGLGLAIVRHWTERLGGHITVASPPGQGTTMRLSIPLKAVEASESSPPDRPEVRMPAPRVEWPSGLFCPEVEVLAQAEELIRIGAVSDLADWSQALGEGNPAWTEFARRIKHLAERGELRTLAALLAQCRTEQEEARARQHSPRSTVARDAIT